MQYHSLVQLIDKVRCYFKVLSGCHDYRDACREYILSALTIFTGAAKKRREEKRNENNAY